MNIKIQDDSMKIDSLKNATNNFVLFAFIFSSSTNNSLSKTQIIYQLNTFKII